LRLLLQAGISTCALAVFCVVLPSAVAAQTASGAVNRSSTTARSLVLYSVATAEQFVNNKDDRERGTGTNPFGNFHDASPTTKQAKGPFPGDEVLFKFAVYDGRSLRRPVGSAGYDCFYNFDRNVYCDAIYTLGDGTLIGSGGFSFDATSFDMAIVGGSGAYKSLRGEMKAQPAQNHSQRLVFTLG
jgi:hypothetical protein